MMVILLNLGGTPNNCLPGLLGSFFHFQWRPHQVRNNIFFVFSICPILVIPFFAKPRSMANDDIAHKQTSCLHYRSSSRASGSSGPSSLLKLSPISLVCPEKNWMWYPCRGILVGSKDRHNLLSDSARRDCWGNQRALLPCKPILQLLLPTSWSPLSPEHRLGSYQGKVDKQEQDHQKRM